MKSGLVFVSAVMMVFVLSSCRDTTIDPFDNGDRLFTIYGFLNPLDTLQTIRIIPVSRRNEPLNGSRESIKTIEAEVFSMDLSDFTVREWQHSLKQFPDNTWGHFFTGNFAVRAGHTYRLIITRIDGSSTTAQTTVPNNGDLLIVERSDPFLHPTLGLVQNVTIPEGRNIWDFQTIYRIRTGGITRQIIVPFEEADPLVMFGARTVTLRLGQDQGAVARAIAALPQAEGVSDTRLVGMGMLFRIVDENWFTFIDKTDAEILSRGDSFTNVRNGAGFWGSMGLLSHEWPVPLELSQVLGYSN